MKETIRDYFLYTVGLNEKTAMIISYIVLIFVIFLISMIADRITKGLLLNSIKKIVSKTHTRIDEMLFDNKVFHRLAHLVPAIIIYLFAHEFEPYSSIIISFALAYMILMITLTLFKIIDTFIDYYRTKDYSKGRPLKGIMTVIKIVITVFMGGLIIVVFTRDSTAAWALVSGFGGTTAILTLVFKDSILGLVAGFQLASSKLLKIGDWIELPQYGADGEVVDISLTKIMIQNWDNTHTTIPAYKFIDDAFKSWEGMSRSGGRRIKRALFIDMKSIRFLDDSLYHQLIKIDLLKGYLQGKQREIKQHNQMLTADLRQRVNGRRLTNIGTFRAYILEYLKNHPKIHKNFTLIVRQLSPTEKGLPLEIYCFANDTDWVNYEEIQSDIFDHLFAIISEFDLKVYQSPSGSDIVDYITSDSIDS